MRTLWVAALVAMTTAGCAVVDENNRPVTRFFDENAAPDSKGVRLALAPIAIPVGMTTLAIDAVLINPVLQLPEAFSETMGLVSEVDSTGPLEIVVFPMRVVTFVVVFTGLELALCLFPIQQILGGMVG